MNNGELAFGAAEEVIGILGRQRHRQRIGIGKADILAGEAHQPPQQIQRFFTGGQHAFEIVERRIGIGATQRFVQRRDQPVMALAILVIDRHPAVEQCRQSRRVERFIELDGIERFDLVEQKAAIAIGRRDQRGASFGRYGQRPRLAGFGAIEQLAERRLVESPNDQHLGTAEDGGVEFKAGVLGCRADQRHRAILDDVEKAVLLSAIEAMDLVDEQQCLLPGPRSIAGFGKQLLQFGNTREHRRNADKAQAHRLGKQPRDAGLAGAGRPPENEAGEAARRDHPADGAFRPGQMRLADNFSQCLRPQPFGERRIGGRRARGASKQVSHRCAP